MGEVKYRHRTTGIYGSAVKDYKGKVTRVKADEGWSSPISDWVREPVFRPVLRSQLAIAAYAADAALRALYTHRRPDVWQSMKEEDRAAFINGGPRALPSRDNIKMRQDVFEFIMKQLEEANKSDDEDEDDGNKPNDTK